MKNRLLNALLYILLPLFISVQAFGQNDIVSISGPTQVCLGCYSYKAVVSPGTTFPPPHFYQWSLTGPNGSVLTNSDSASAIFCFQQQGVYVINLQVLSAIGVVANATYSVYATPNIQVNIVSNNPATCNQDSTQGPNLSYCEKVCPYSTVTYSLDNASTPPSGTNSQITWQVVGAQSFTVNPPFNNSVTVNWGNSGAGSVVVIVNSLSNPAGGQCAGEDAICVTIIEEPKAQFDSNPISPPSDTLQICKGQTVYFDNQSQHADSYEWFFSDDATISSEINPQHTFLNPGLYTVQLVARSACWCADTTQTVIEVLDAEAPTLSCVGDVCPGATVSYYSTTNCSGISWASSPNATVLAGGTPGADSITVAWGAGPLGTITLSNFTCTGLACPQPTVVQVPIIDDNAEIRGPERVCPDAEEVYSIDPFGGTGFVWTLSGGGAILDGQGTNRVSVRWNSFPSPNITRWLSVRYDNCYLGCGGVDSIPVQVLSSFFIDGPVESCQNASANYSARLTYNNQNILCNWTLYAPDGSVAWSSPAASADIAPTFASGPGLYRIFAVPDNPATSCIDQTEWAIQVPDLPAIPTGITGASLICPGTSFTYEATGVAPNASIRWEIQNGPAAPITVMGNPINVTWNASGPYQLRVVQLSADGLGCTSDPALLNLQVLGSLALNGPAARCADSKATYSAQLIPGLDYQWSIIPADAGTIASGQGSNQIEVFWQTPGNHQVNLDICGKSASRAVTIHALPAPMVSHPASLCPGATATVQTTAPFANYTWANAGGGGLGSTATVDIGPGDYVVSVTDANGCAGKTTFSIATDPAPQLTVSTADPTAFCANSRFVTMRALVSAGAAYSYAWFRDGNPLGVNGPVYTTNQYGAYTVQATSAAGCTATAGPIYIVEDCTGGGGGFPCTPRPPCPPGSVNLQIDPSPRCDSMRFALSGSDFLVGSGSWAFVQSGGQSFGTPIGDQVNFVFPEAGYFIVAAYAELTDGTLCRIIDSVLVEAVAQFTVLPECPGLVTNFEESSAHMPGSGISAWNWDFGDPASGANNSSAQTPTHLYNPGGNYSVSLTVTANSGCTASRTLPANIPLATPPVVTPPASICESNALEFTATGSDLRWNFDDPGSGALNQATGKPVYHRFAAGSYMVTATATDNFGCTASASQAMNIIANSLSGAIVPGNPAPLCEGKSIVLTAPAGGTTYLWSDNSSGATLTVDKEGRYSVTLTDANGCTYAPPPVAVDILPSPDALIKALLTNELGQTIGVEYPTHSVCFGEDVRLFASGLGAYTYTWSTGTPGVNVEFTKVRNNLLSIGTHIYTVTVTETTTGCTAVTDPFVVTVKPVPTGFSIANSVYPPCAGALNTLSYSGPTPGNWQYIWNNSKTDLPLMTGNPGLYFLRVINEFGCEARSNTLTILPGPNSHAIPAGCHTRCKPDTICMPPIPNVASWQWYFNGSAIPGATSPNFVAQQSGTYYAELTDWWGCTNQSGPLSLNLYDGYGNVIGQVWSDVNNNGLIDGPDTLVSGIAVILLDNAVPVATQWSGAAGAFAFANILSKNYVVEIDAGLLPPGWQIVIGQRPANLVGCGAESQVGLLLRNACSTVFNSTVQLQACPGDFANYNGTMIPTGGSQVFQLTTADGCDSLVTVSVAALPTSTGTLNASACPGTNYDYNGTLIPAGTSQSFVLQNYLGCDSVLTVNVAALQTSTGALNASACPGTNYDYNGTLIPAGSSQSFVLQNYLGCDSVLTVNVAALQTSMGALNASACPGTNYDYNGTLIPAGSSQSFVLQNYLGCDSVLTVNVATLPTSMGTLNASACPGANYDYNGTLIPAGSSHSFVLQNYLGCDSVLTVNVAALPTSAGTLNASACPGANYDYNGTLIPAGSSQSFILQNYLGCDSVLTVNVATLQTSTGTLNASACPGANYDYNGTLIPAGSSQSFVLQNYLGCDSVLMVNVGISQTSASSLVAPLCPGETFPYQGVILQIGDTQAFILQNAAGCDSVVTVTAVGLTSSSETLNVSVCPGESYSFDGTTLQIGETRVFTYTNSEGCDSIITVIVSAFYTATFGLTATASCHNTGTGSLLVGNPAGGLAPYRYSLDGLAFQDELLFDDLLPGVYTVWLEDSNGCLFETSTTVPSIPALEVELAATALLPCSAAGIPLSPLVGGNLSGLSYNWSNGVQTPAITVYDPGLVWVDIQNVCETLRREVQVSWAEVDAEHSYLYVPNVFAPQSSDPDNSKFRPAFAPGLQLLNYKMEIFDRWGNLMFRTQDTQEGWTGPFRSEDMLPGVYVWTLRVDVEYCGRLRPLRLEGDVTIVR